MLPTVVLLTLPVVTRLAVVVLLKAISETDVVVPVLPALVGGSSVVVLVAVALHSAALHRFSATGFSGDFVLSGTALRLAGPGKKSTIGGKLTFSAGAAFGVTAGRMGGR